MADSPRGFKKAKQKAESIIDQKDRLSTLLRDAKAKSAEKAKRLESIKEDLSALLRLLQAWLNRSYTKVPTKSILYTIAALLYFVNPFDLIPDFIPFSGFIDDFSVISFVIKSILKDIEDFKAWEKEEETNSAQ